MTLKIYAETNLPTKFGNFKLRLYRNEESNQGHYDEPIALIKGYFNINEAVNIRIHSACMTSEIFGSCKCDCKDQLDKAMTYIQDKSGLIIYLHQEGRGIGLGDKIRVYALQEQGYDTIEANEMLGLPVDARTYENAVTILQDLGIQKVNLLTNNPDKVLALESAGISIVDRISIVCTPNEHSQNYLETKKNQMGHLL